MTRAPVGDEAASSVVRSGQPCAVGGKRTRGPTVDEDCASLHERANGGSNATCTNGIKTLLMVHPPPNARSRACQ